MKYDKAPGENGTAIKIIKMYRLESTIPSEYNNVLMILVHKNESIIHKKDYR